MKKKQRPHADKPATKPPAKEFKLENIIGAMDEATKVCKTTWLILLTVSIYSAITLLNIDDAAFFSITARTALPIISVEVPTLSFILLLPLLLIVLQIEMLVNIDKLTNLTRTYTVSFRASEQILIPTQSWVGTDWVMQHTLGWAWMNQQKKLSNLLFITSCCIFPLVLLIGLFFKTLVLQDSYLSVYILLTVCVIIVFDYKILYPLKALITRERLSELRFWITSVMALAFLSIGLLIATYHHFVSPWTVMRNIDRSITADLRAKDLSITPEGWDKFKASHPNGLDTSVGEVRLVLSKIRSPDMTSKKLNFADLELAFLANTRFAYCQAVGADFRGAILDGSSFWGSNLFAARFDNSSLNSVDFIGANIKGVNFVGADLRYAKVPDLGQTFGDASTLLPEGVERPIHWPTRGDEAQFQKWILRFEGSTH